MSVRGKGQQPTESTTSGGQPHVQWGQMRFYPRRGSRSEPRARPVAWELRGAAGRARGGSQAPRRRGRQGQPTRTARGARLSAGERSGRTRVRTWSGPLSNILRVRGNWWEWGVYCTPEGPAAPGRPVGSSRLTGCLATSLVRLELLALDVGGEPLRRGWRKQRGSPGARHPEPRRQAAPPGSAQPLASAARPGSSARTPLVPWPVHAPSEHNAPFLLLPRGSGAQRKDHAGGGGRCSTVCSREPSAQPPVPCGGNTGPTCW